MRELTRIELEAVCGGIRVAPAPRPRIDLRRLIISLLENSSVGRARLSRLIAPKAAQLLPYCRRGSLRLHGRGEFTF